MKLKFFVIGTCYSGYMFKEKLLGTVASGNIEMVRQHQHDSFISMMTRPFDIDVAGAKSKYQWDFNYFASSIFKKDIIKRMVEENVDYILFDNYAEAECPLIKMDDETYITSNYYIRESTIYPQLLEKGTLIPTGAPERLELYKKYVVEFFREVRAALPKIKVILVQTKATHELYNPQTKERTVFHYSPKIKRLNEIKLAYDKLVLEHVPGITCLHMSDEYNVADTMIKEDYNYDVSHNHYAVDFYRRQYQKLQGIIIADLLGGKERTRYFNQAICIIARDDYPLLLLMAKIYKDFFRVYINIDMGLVGKVFTEDQIARLREIPNVSVLVKYRAPKGSYNELLAMIEMGNMAFQHPDVTYVHYTTSNDFPIRPINAIYNYFEEYSNGCSFLNNHANGDRNEIKKVAEYTFKYYNYLYNGDESDPLVKEMSDESMRHQKGKGISRDSIGEFTDVYKGVIGGSLTREAYFYCMDYVEKHPEYLEEIKFTRLRAEFFFHTILFNAPFLRERISGGIRGAKHDWVWDNEKKDFACLDVENYNKLKQNKNTLYVGKVTSENQDVLKEVLKDIGTPYSLEY